MRRKPADPYPTTTKVDERLAQIARILASTNLTDTYRATLGKETDALLDRRLVLTLRELVQTG